jgi:uncharacterized membrane protein
MKGERAMMGIYGGLGAMGLWGGAVMVLFWVVILLLVLWAIRALFPGERRSAHDVALDLLRHRHVAGEISRAEYEQARGALG